MSMNLNGKIKKTGEYVILMQTPTWVSYMVTDSWKKDENNIPKNRHWKDTRKLYLDWCYSLTLGMKTEEESKYQEDWFKQHKKYIMGLGKIEWFVT